MQTLADTGVTAISVTHLNPSMADAEEACSVDVPLSL